MVGREIAQTIGLLVPLEETLVKKPTSCALLVGSEIELATRVSDGVGANCSFQIITVLPPLLTTRARESLGSTKYAGPHQQCEIA